MNKEKRTFSTSTPNEYTGNDCSTYAGDAEYFGISIKKDDNKRIKYGEDEEDEGQ